MDNGDDARSIAPFFLASTPKISSKIEGVEGVLDGHGFVVVVVVTAEVGGDENVVNPADATAAE